uniref:Glutaredoxin domain-containing protein n=1 Tax=Meloidogyne incognita TaxID=6306 RepID=A0A914M5X5_MELIC
MSRVDSFKEFLTNLIPTIYHILRLPAVLYADSSSSGSRKLETLLREVYGLPLVTFYVDRIGNGKPRLVERNLEQLTAHRGLPYLFICGTFIGSKEHIQNYHEKHHIPQLVEYVCNGEGKRETTKENITTTNNTLSEKQKTQKLKLMDEQQQPLFNEKIKENKNNFKNLKEKKRK